MNYDFSEQLASVKKKNDELEQITREEFLWRAQELKRCRDDIVYFANKYFRIISPDVNEGRGGLGVIKTYKKQEDLLRFFQKYNRVVTLAARQSGKSTSYNIFCLWKLCFFESTNIMLLAQREKTAIELLGRLRLAYEYLPDFLKPSIVSYNKSSIEFTKHSKIEAFATASQGARGTSANIVIVDECAFIPDNIADDFMASVYPVISRDKKSKVIFVSTPNGASTKNLFYQTWKSAGESDPNDINAWQRFRMDWWDVPGRDEEWKENQIKTIGIERFNQEFGNDFARTGSIRLFSSSVLENLRMSKKREPEVTVKITSMDESNIWEVKVWERPKTGHTYVAASDIAEGIGGDSSVLLILDVTDMNDIKLALSFANANISIAEFASLSARLLNAYNCPMFLCEANGVGAGYISILTNHFKYEDILSFDEKVPGIHSTQKNKMNACLWAKEFFNIYKHVTLADENLLSQMEVFSRTSSKTNPSYAAIKGEHDDYILALVWALYLLNKDVVEKQSRYVIFGSMKTSLGTEVITKLIDTERLGMHFVEQFLKDKLRAELELGNSKEIQLPWWNADNDDIVIQRSQDIEEPMPFVFLGVGDTGYSFEDEQEYGVW